MKIIQIHAISNTSKMPCPSYSLPAQACRTGSKLAKVAGSVCSGCYALKGFYNMPTVAAPRAGNLDMVNNPEWVAEMVDLIGRSKAARVGFFRWHDSGDIQSLAHLRNIALVAEAMPGIKFWLPTKEKQDVLQYVKQWGDFPENLTVRLSAPMVDGEPPKAWKLTSTVHKAAKAHGVTCNAPANAGKCGTCRACWDKAVSNVSYALH